MDEDLIKRTAEVIRRMNKDNVPVKHIEEDLRNAGLAPYEIKRVLKEARVEPTPSEIHEVLSTLHAKIDSGEHIKPALKAIDKNKKKTDNLMVKMQELHGDVAEHKESLEDLAESIEGHREALNKIGFDIKTRTVAQEEAFEYIKNELESIKDILSEIKPIMHAIKELNEKLLDINKRMLTKL